MIDKSKSGHINFEVTAPNDVAEQFKKDFQKIEDKYKGQPIKETMIAQMKMDIENL